MYMDEKQRAQIIHLLWSSMKRDPEHKDRVQTGYGTKTQEGLIACIEGVMGEGESDKPSPSQLQFEAARRVLREVADFQGAFWERLKELEDLLGVELDSTVDYHDTTVETILADAAKGGGE